MTTLLPDDMYDAIYPLNIPQSAKYVAGYVDGGWPWMARSPSLFPNAVKVTISAVGAVVAKVGDRETGDLTPAGLVNYIVNCRAAGVNTLGYCNFSSWGEAQGAFNSNRVTQPPWWIAQYDGIRNLPVLNGIQAVAKQYANPGPYDLSCISDTFLEIVGGIVTTPGDFIAALIAFRDGNGRNLFDYGAQSVSTGFNNQATLATLSTNVVNLSTTEKQTDADVKAAQAELDTRSANIATVLASLPTVASNVAPTDAQMATLTAAMEAFLPSYTVSISPKTA